MTQNVTHPSTRGVLLVQLGTPEAPTPSAVGRFLTDFLTDPRVVNLPWLWRQLLVRGIIVPFRRGKSAQAYQQIWTSEGSPLRVHTEQLTAQVQHALGERAQVVMAMRYGEPSIAQGLQKLLDAGCDELVVLPLFPQYAAATTASVVDAVTAFLAKQAHVPTVRWVHDFYDHPAFVQTWSTHLQSALQDQPVDHLLFSYHGLPVAQVQASERGRDVCDQTQPCPVMDAKNRYCYRAQCYATTRAIVQRLGDAAPAHSVSFQSRLGRLPWIQPYTEEVLKALYAQGVRHLAIASPAFVADCLETLEELGLRGREDWLAMGGASFTLVPSLNTQPQWVQAVCALAQST